MKTDSKEYRFWKLIRETNKEYEIDEQLLFQLYKKILKNEELNNWIDKSMTFDEMFEARKNREMSEFLNDGTGVELLNLLSERENAMTWWNNLVGIEQFFHTMESFPDRRASSLTGREIEIIYKKQKQK